MKNTSKLIKQLAALSENDDLANVVVTAALELDGGLNDVGSVKSKLIAAIGSTHIPRIAAFAVSDKQNDILIDTPGMDGHKSGTERPRLLGAANFAQLVAQLHGLPRGRRGVKPIDYARVMKYNLAGFEGREWLFNEINKAMEPSGRDSGYIVLAHV